MLIGIDLGGTNIAAGLVNEEGQLLQQMSVPTDAHRSPEEVMQDIYDLIEKMIEASDHPVGYIGVGIPGLVNKNMSVVLKCANLNWHNVLLKEKLDQLNIPVLIDNDANVAAYAEYKIGSLQGARNAMVLTLGTGLGAGIIVEGKEVRGGFGLGGEAGHMVIGENFYDCNCGRNGCFETFASATALIKYAEKLVQETDLASKLRDLDKITARDVVDLSKEGDVIAVKAFDRFIDYLAKGIVNMINLLDPNKIALGGGVSGAGDYLLDKLNAEIQKHLFIPGYDYAELVIAELGNDAGIIGAALLAKDFYEREL